MASMRDIKRRKVSVQSTQQITKAMKLVATVKLQKARSKAEKNKPYFSMLYSTICSILEKTINIEHKYLLDNLDKDIAVIAVTSNRGLAGGYNNNIVKLVDTLKDKKQKVQIYAVGKKGMDGLNRKGYKIVKDYSEVINEPLFQDAKKLTNDLLFEYEKQNIGEIYLAYTNFKNTVSQEAKMIKLLPLTKDDFQEQQGKQDMGLIMNFEPSEEEVLDKIIPKYLTNIIYGAFLEAIASENGARMQAMDSATNNADDMISSLSLKYNRARQSSITQELTEIIAGSEAIN